MSKDKVTKNGIKSNFDFVRSMTLKRSSTIPNQGHAPDSSGTVRGEPPPHPGFLVRMTPPSFPKQHSDVTCNLAPSLILDRPETQSCSEQGRRTHMPSVGAPRASPEESYDLGEVRNSADVFSEPDIHMTNSSCHAYPPFSDGKRHSFGSLGSEVMRHETIPSDLLPNNVKPASDPSFDQSPATLRNVNSILSAAGWGGGVQQPNIDHPIGASNGRTSGTDSSRSSQNSLAHPSNLDSKESHAETSTKFLIPPCIFNVPKTRSESALSKLTTPNALDPRVNSSHSNLVPPSDLISSHPRRDSAWTAEVLSIEIQVDYVMDPAELWGSGVIQKMPNKGVPDSDGVNDNGPQSDLPDYVGDGPDLSKVDLTRPINNEDGTHKQESTDVSNPKEDTKSRDSAQFNLPPREHWENRFQFLLSTIGYAVDLSNVWRFPFLCYKNGGGAFLIPYFTTLIFGAMPVFFMEMCLGQFNRCGPTAVWDKMAPMFKGIGIASCFMAYIVAFYYNVIIGWSFFYLFASFTSVLPWTTCFNPFNSGNCWQIGWDANVTNASSASDGADVDSRPPDNRTYNASVSVSSTMEYFERGMLELHHSTGLEDLGVIRWQLLLCTFLTFTVLYFCLWKGVKSTGKVVYITATLPYVIMTILLIRGVLLPGAEDGIRYFITPKIDSLRKPKVWIDAAVQIFFSVGSGFGTHIAYASYNKFHNDCKRDCIITVIVNSFTSLFSGFVIFSYLGYMALRTQKDIDKVATEGPGLVFIVYPEAIATLPGSVGWAIIFFFMLLSLGLDSAFGGLESPLTGIRDELSQLMKYKYFREVLTLIIIMSAFLFSIPCLMQGGMYVFTILDTFAAGTSIVFIVLCQVVAVSWIYGMPQFCDDVQKMTGQRPSIFWRICWKFICPSLLLVIVASSIISYQPLTYRTSVGTYVYPYYANIIGWIIGISSMILVPGYFVYKFFRLKGSCKQRLALGMSPACEHEEIIQKGYVKRFQRSHWLSL